MSTSHPQTLGSRTFGFDGIHRIEQAPRRGTADRPLSLSPWLVACRCGSGPSWNDGRARAVVFDRLTGRVSVGDFLRKRR